MNMAQAVPLLIALVISSPGSAANYYLSPTGSDSNPCTEAAPCATFPHGVSHLSPGDTLYLRSGTYREPAFRFTDLPGTAASQIAIKSYPGERATLDGGFAQFRVPGNSDWTLHQTLSDGSTIWRSMPTFPGRESIRGQLFHGDRWYTLITVPSMEYLTALNHTPAASYYLGPSLYYDAATGQVYVRLTKSDPNVVFGDYGVPANSDPRQNAMVLFPALISAAWNFSSSVSWITFEGLDFKHYDLLFRISNTATNNLTFRDLNILNTGAAWRMLNGHDVLIDDVVVEQGYPPWISWWDAKGGAKVAYSTIHQYGVALQQGAPFNVEVRNSTFRQIWDGFGIFDGAHDINMHHNTIEHEIEAVTLETSTYNVQLHHNLIRGGGPSHYGGGTPPVAGAKWLHHNVVDASDPMFWNRLDPLVFFDSDQGFYWHYPFPRHTAAGQGTGDPWKLYNNTVLFQPNATADPGMASWQTGGTKNQSGVPHDVWNNIFVLNRADRYIVRSANVADGSERFDGNAYWRVTGSSVNFSSLSGVTSGATTFTTLSSFLSSPARVQTQSYYAPGWEAAGIEQDPQLSATYVPGNAAVHNGGANLTSSGLPGIDGNYRGAVPLGGDGSEVGDPDTAIPDPPPPGDTTAPAAVADLAVAGQTSSSISLEWTSPGDDGNTGTAASYDLRYSNAPISSEAAFAAATEAANEPAPTVAGSAQSITVGGLSPAATYHFALKTVDEALNVSALSNSAQGTTTGGGGGFGPPQTIQLNPVVDTWLEANRPTTSNGASTKINVDLDDPTGSAKPTQGLLRFNLLGIPVGSQIDSATLVLQTSNSGGKLSRLHRMLVPWSETATWNSLGSGVQANGVEAAVTADFTWPNSNIPVGSGSVNVLAAVQALLASGVNHGWAILPADTNGWEFNSREASTGKPRLDITYRAPTGPTPQAPIDIQMSSTSFMENDELVATLTATDPDSGPPFTFTLLTDPTGDFQIIGDQLTSLQSLDFENLGAGWTISGNATASITIRVADEGGRTYDEAFTIVLQNVNEPPTDIAISQNSFVENTPFSAMLSASDPDSSSLVFELVDDPTGNFQIVGNQLSLLSPIDFEALPSGWTNQGDGTARATITIGVTDDGFNAYSEQFVLTVQDVPPPSLAFPSALSLGWSAQNATSCTASGGWTGSKATAGIQALPAPFTGTYVLTCNGPDGSVQRSVTITVP